MLFSIGSCRWQLPTSDDIGMHGDYHHQLEGHVSMTDLIITHFYSLHAFFPTIAARPSRVITVGPFACFARTL